MKLYFRTIYLLIFFLLPYSTLCFAQLQGPLEGVIETGIYTISGDISVEADAELEIEPGVVFEFETGLVFTIHGNLTATGVEGDSIYFVRSQGHDAWRGIDFSDSASDSSRLEYCVITGSNSCGISLFQSSPTISRCLIRDNINLGERGGGIKCMDSSSPLIEYCTISGNYGELDAGGIYMADHSEATIVQCLIDNNTSAYGGGVYFNTADAMIIDCVISGNTGTEWGGGIYMFNCSPTISGTLIMENFSEDVGGGIHCRRSSPLIDRCTIVANDAVTGGSGIYSWNFAAADIQNTIISLNLNGGIHVDEQEHAQISFCNIYGNLEENFSGNPDENLGEIQLVNLNGDSCDSFFNIFHDPLFDNPEELSFHLTSGSPCIDAGTPAGQADPDNSIPDIGAYYYHQPIIYELVVNAEPWFSPVIIPGNGGGFRWNVTVENLGQNEVEYDAWTIVIVPDGTEFGPTMLYTGLTIPAGVTIEMNPYQNVPAYAPPGDYVYLAITGLYPEPASLDSLDFTVLGEETNNLGFTNQVSNWICSADQNIEFSSDNSKNSTKIIENDVKIYPNPLNPGGTISFSAPINSDYAISIYDLLGREVRNIGSGVNSTEQVNILFNGEHLASGSYFIRTTVDNKKSYIRKVVIMK